MRTRFNAFISSLLFVVAMPAIAALPEPTSPEFCQEVQKYILRKEEIMAFFDGLNKDGYGIYLNVFSSSSLLQIQFQVL